jgi:hypothetical protein
MTSWDLGGNTISDPTHDFLGTKTGDNQQLAIQTNGAERIRVDTGGNVGIGTSSPGSKLAISDGTNGVSLHPGEASGIGFNRNVADGTIYNSGISAWQFSARDAYFALEGYNGASLNSWVLTKAGNVGIGTTAPTSTLHVSGDVMVTGDVLLTGADCAEQFDIVGTQLPEPGTVVVLDEAGALRESRGAYDKKVAGVISGAGSCQPGLVLDNRPSEEPRATLALVGKVYCKVDAQYSPIEVGDLLTTSPTPGHAMKAENPYRAFGCVIGKALRALKQGRELIPILIALQ